MPTIGEQVWALRMAEARKARRVRLICHGIALAVAMALIGWAMISAALA